MTPTARADLQPTKWRLFRVASVCRRQAAVLTQTPATLVPEAAAPGHQRWISDKAQPGDADRAARGGSALRGTDLMHTWPALALLLLGFLTPPAGWCATVRDDLGRLLSLPQPARRIVTLAPHATELVLAAGAGRYLVGVAPGGSISGSIASLPRVGGTGGLDRERLLELRPDLVIGWQPGNRAADLEWIVHSGIALYRSAPTALRDVARSIRSIGRLSATEATAEAAATAFTDALTTPCAGLELLPAYVVVWQSPAMTVGGEHWLNDVLRIGGFRNVFADVPRGVFAIAAEAAYRRESAATISLVRVHDGSERDRLADLLSRPAPGLAEAGHLLCARRLDAEAARQAPGFR
jgi:iron complex transport system substrate-binding protein